jgi:uncharacterized protein (TIGR02147 family)
MRERIALRLGLSPEVYLQMPVKVGRGTRQAGILRFEQLTEDRFALIADWYHYAILELTLLKPFRGEPAWIAKKLGITVSEVNIAVERLIRLELLEIVSKSEWKLRQAHNSNASNPLTAAAFRKLQKQILEQAIRALEVTPVTERDQSSMTMAISSHKLEEAIERITRFRRDLCSFLQEDPAKDRVYQLSISLFPVTSPEIAHEKTES